MTILMNIVGFLLMFIIINIPVELIRKYILHMGLWPEDDQEKGE